jgi:hypothetical protein
MEIVFKSPEQPEGLLHLHDAVAETNLIGPPVCNLRHDIRDDSASQEVAFILTRSSCSAHSNISLHTLLT